MKEESRIVRGRVVACGCGLLANPMGEGIGFLLDTGDRVVMKELPGINSPKSFMNSEVINVLLPLPCAEAKSLIHWISQHSTYTVHAALVGRDEFVINQIMLEMDICMSFIAIAMRQFNIPYFSITTGQLDPRASDAVSIALLHLSILAALYTIRQSCLKDWFKYKGKRVSSERCYHALLNIKN